MNAAYEALTAEAEAQGLPKYYRDDLFVHDKKTLDRIGDGTPFLWMLRECGTITCIPNSDEASYRRTTQSGHPTSMAWAISANKTWPDGLWYEWTGKVLRPRENVTAPWIEQWFNRENRVAPPR